MRIVIDMQGAQTGSRFRGIGRYTLSLVKAIVRNKGNHEIVLVLSGLFSETISPIREEFKNILPEESFRVWNSIGPTMECDPSNKQRRELAELFREAFLADLKPDVVLITSLFEGLGDDAVTSVGRFDQSVLTVAILYDLIPLLNPDSDFRNSKLHKNWYARKIDSIRKCRMLLAISESARSEAIIGLDFTPDSVVNISGACDDFFKVSESIKIDKDYIWHKFGIEKQFVMYTGGADERKNLDSLIIAYSQLPKSVRESHQLVFVGKMPQSYVDKYLGIARSFGLSDKEFILTGYIEDNDLLALYKTCRLFVFPSLHEGFGIPPLEAMACGAAVIGSNVTSLPEVLGWNEMMFDPTSVDDITEKMEMALTDHDFHGQLVRHGELQHKSFSWEESGVRAITALERLSSTCHTNSSELICFGKTAIFKTRRLKILVVKLDHMGDFILAIPALTKLKAKYPFSDIDIIVGSWNSYFAESLNIFSKIYTYDLFSKKSSVSAEFDYEALNLLVGQLPFYEIALDFRRQDDTRFILNYVNAGIKIGYQTFQSEFGSFLDIMLPAYPDIPYERSPLNLTPISVSMIRLVDAIPFDPNDFITFPRIVKENVKVVTGSVAIFPMAGTDAREWELQRFISLAGMLANNSLISEVNIYFANKDDAHGFCLGKNINIHTALDMNELTVSLSRNSLCIANNSGGAHLASYLGLKVIGIYSGHEIPDEWGPQFFDSYVIHRAAQCSPCHGALKNDCINGLYCIDDISVSDVYNKAIELLSCDGIKQEQSSDLIVRRLLSKIGELISRNDEFDLLEISQLISLNHPGYPGPPDLNSLRYGLRITHRSNVPRWVGFSGVEHEFRWTDGYHAEIIFGFSGSIERRSMIELEFNTFGEQDVMLTFNDSMIYNGTLCGDNILLELPILNLKPDQNTLRFDLPDAKMPGAHDRRKVGLAVRSIKITTK